MWLHRHLSIVGASLALVALVPSLVTSQQQIAGQRPLGVATGNDGPTTAASTSSDISIPLFAELEELSRIVDISYCVGTTGIARPFSCASRCADFPAFELVDSFNTGPLMSDSCGYIVVDHGTSHMGVVGKGRLIVAFRGTYSIANTIVDLRNNPQEYVPYPDEPSESMRKRSGEMVVEQDTERRGAPERWTSNLLLKRDDGAPQAQRPACLNCTVHTGFWTSWQNTRPLVIPHLEALRERYPDHDLHLVGHSLGGAVAALAALELEGRGWHPIVTTFGEPRVGNSGLRDWIDATFSLPTAQDAAAPSAGRYRRVTHVDDPVPLLPLQEWGYRAHAGEVYISKASLQPTVSDVRLCLGDEDANCIASAELNEAWFNVVVEETPEEEILAAEDEGAKELPAQDISGEITATRKRWAVPIPARYKIWQLFFAHRDYFWRLGLCVPGGDPLDWGKDRYHFHDDDDDDDNGEGSRAEL